MTRDYYSIRASRPSDQRVPRRKHRRRLRGAENRSKRLPTCLQCERQTANAAGVCARCLGVPLCLRRGQRTPEPYRRPETPEAKAAWEAHLEEQAARVEREENLDPKARAERNQAQQRSRAKYAAWAARRSQSA